MNDLHESCYALPALRKYPIHTKEASIDSLKTFLKEASNYSAQKASDIFDNLTKAASIHQICLEDVHVEQELQKEASTLNIKAPNDSYITMTKISTASDLIDAVDSVIEARNTTTRKTIADAAKYVLWKAASSDFDLTEDRFKRLSQLAGAGVGDREEIQYELDKRATLNVFPKEYAEQFWKYSNTLKGMTDEEFYKEATLNTICNVLEDIDCLYGNQSKYGSALQYPESVCFKDTVDDLKKQTENLLYIPSIDTTLSKRALLERKDTVNSFLNQHYGVTADALETTGFATIALLAKHAAEAFLEAVDK